MSFIERALQKARAGTDASPVLGSQRDAGTLRARGLQPASAPADVPSPAAVIRVDTQPQLIITETLLSQQGLRAPPDQEHQQRAEYRHIKHRLLADVNNPEVGRLIVVSSALQSEGKSFSAAHLALSLAVEPDYSVLLVDADVIRPNLSRMFGLTEHPGLMDAVADPAIDVQSLEVTTNVEGLSMLPAGRRNENATEYFASARMRQVMHQLLAVPNRLVIVDSLPLLLTTEARALVSLGGQVLLVVRAERTPQSAVLQALDLLSPGTNVKLLLNAVPRSKALDYLGYGYDYSYNNKTEKGRE